MSTLKAADTAAQGLGAMKITINLFGQAVMSIVLLSIGIYVKTGYRIIPQGVYCIRACRRGGPLRARGGRLQKCGVGSHLQQDRPMHRLGQWFRAAQARVPGPTTAPRWPAGARAHIVCRGRHTRTRATVLGVHRPAHRLAVMWLVTFMLRNSTWFRRLHGISAIMN